MEQTILNSVLRSMEELIFIYDNNHTLQIVNQDNLRRVLGYDVKEIRDLNFILSILHEEDRLKMIQALENLEKLKEVSIKHRVKHKQGKYLWFETIGKLAAGNNQEKRYILISRRIKDKKKPQEYETNTQERWRTLIEEAPDIIFTVDKEGIITYINHPPLGLTRKRAIGTNCIDYVSENYKVRVKNSIEKVFKTGEQGEFEICARGSQGRRSWYSTKLKAIRVGDMVKEVLLITRDITEKKKYETRLKKLEKFKSDLLTRTSHELKTPLISIKGYADLILGLHYNQINDEIKLKLNEIKLGCKRLEDIIKNLLIGEKLDSCNREINSTRNNLTSLIFRVIRELEPLAKQRKIKIISKLPDQDIFTKFEKKGLHDALSNILMNGIKYTPGGGEIVIKLEKEKENLILTFSDTGIGLTNEEKKKIFAKFGKIEHYGEGYDIITEGSGLGLFIAKKIIELHEGKIWAKSKGRMKGTTFFISLPKIKQGSG